eukprot:TRINITY_DN13534_c0_g1_i1.p1 TRINITY_DN13534_c0_g1~~TRINITY_DN13534_c0_g1_i1.p1  ORF type:complete len:327 (+),score=116.13 TRINITY_DN13534_c0_g1_i1:76-981(+)
MGADWTLLPYLRALGLVGRSPLEAEVAQLEATKQRLEAQVSEGDPEVAAMHAAVEGPRERRAEAGRRLADTFAPHLDVYNEKAQQAQGVDAMSGVVEKHIQKVEGYNEERGEMYGYKAHYLHSAAVVMSQLSDKVNLGFPFAQDLHALNSIAPSPVPDPVHEAVVDSMRSVAQVGAPTFPALCSSFSKMSDALFPSGGGGPAVAALGAEGAKELEGKFRHASEKLEGRAVSAAIKAVEGLADEMSLLGGGAERNIRAWHHGATQYSVAQQGLHFLSCEMSMQRFSMVEAYQANKLRNCKDL